MAYTADELLQRAAQARRENRPADVKRNLTEAAELYRQAGARAELAQTLRSLGEIERHLKNATAARQRYEEAVAILRDEGDALRLAHAVRHLGDLHHEAGRAELAAPCYDEALRIYRAHERTSPLDLANAIRSLAVLKDEAGEADAAGQLWEEAKNLYAAVNVHAGVAESAARLALLARTQGNGGQARRWLAEALAAAHASGDSASIQYVNQTKAAIAD